MSRDVRISVQQNLSVPESTVVDIIQILPGRNRESEVLLGIHLSSRGKGYIKEPHPTEFDYLFNVF
jgi:hypothetical protein